MENRVIYGLGEGETFIKSSNENTTENEINNSNESNSVQFWKFISNLPKSISQRRRSVTSDSLTPEVVGYLARMQQDQTKQNQTQPNTHADNQPNEIQESSKLQHLVTEDDDQESPKLSLGASVAGVVGGECVQLSRDGHRIIKIHQASSSKNNPFRKDIKADLEMNAGKDHGQHHQLLPAQTQSSGKQHQMKLAIATTTTTNAQKTSATTTTSATTSRSSVSSLSSCVLGSENDNRSSESEVDEVRLKWGKKMDFLLSIIGFAVDLANIWRFPYLVYKNGGGVFLIPYVIMLIFGGIPLFFLELCLGQFVKKGPITVWNKICPAMKGVGYCSILISWYVSFYYNVLIGWSVYFIYRSLTSFGEKMPWEDCDNPWNSGHAAAYGLQSRHLKPNFNHTYLDWKEVTFNNATVTYGSDLTTCVSISLLKDMCSDRNETLETCKNNLFFNVTMISPATEFFVKELSQIDQSTGLDNMGHLRTELVLCTLLVYLLHYFSLFRGLETSGKVVWVTATAPYMILSVLLVRGLFLPGATNGIWYYLSPRLEKLADPHVWTDAAVQVFYSIGVGFGVHLTYASFNNHNNNCHRDCLMTSAVNVITSVYSGLVVFVYIGYMAQNLGVEIDKVASEGYSLVFEVYPEALTTLPFARFWSILFFIMLLTLGIDSAMGGLEAVITGIEDEFKVAKNMHRGLLTGLVIASSFVFALISCTQGGAYTLFWFDIYSASVSLLFSALFEALGVVYFYGIDKFILDIESMLGHRPNMFYIICWKYISPLFLGGVIFTSLYTAFVPVYRNYTFPIWSVVLGWCLTFSSVIVVPIFAIVHYFKNRNGNKKPVTRSGGASSASSRYGTNSGKKTTSSAAHQHQHHHHQHQHHDQHHLDKKANWVRSSASEITGLKGSSSGLTSAV